VGGREGSGVLTELRLGEFEEWGSDQVLRLAPLTLFFGPNGAGKSALLQAVRDKAAGTEPELLPDSSGAGIGSLKRSSGTG